MLPDRPTSRDVETNGPPQAAAGPSSSTRQPLRHWPVAGPASQPPPRANTLPLSYSDWQTIAADVARAMKIGSCSPWQVDTAAGLANGEKRAVLAATGMGKSAVWTLLAAAIKHIMARRPAHGAPDATPCMVVLVSVTKAMQDDQSATLAGYLL